MPTSPAPPWVTATIPKPGNRPEENEDAAAADAARLRFAVSDGATEGWQSASWAQRLARSYIRRPPTPADFPGWLATVRKWSPPLRERFKLRLAGWVVESVEMGDRAS